MSIFAEFESDDNLEVNGIEVTYGTTYFMVARCGGANSEFAKFSAAVMKPHATRAANGLIDEDLAVRLLAKIFSHCIVKGWGHYEYDEDGTERRIEGKLPWGRPFDTKKSVKQVEYTRENCIKVLNHPELRDMLLDIQEKASNRDNFLASALEDISKN